MKRRQALASLLGAASAVGLGSSASSQPAADVADWLLRTLGGVEPLPGESEHVVQFLLSVRPPRGSDPRVEPAVTFDPEGSS